MIKTEQIRRYISQVSKKPSYRDVLVLGIFVLLVTCQPDFANGAINLFEVGLYLPGINALLHGDVPFRDFLYLRGPFELYMPLFLMKIFGVHLKVLYAYFYAGTILTMLLCVLIAKEIFRTRYLLWLMTLVLVARTFPRVVFTFWGGMRYAWGLAAVYCAVRFFKTGKKTWILCAGIFVGVAVFTSIEIGVYAFTGVLSGFLAGFIFGQFPKRIFVRSFSFFFLGMLLVVVPYGLYLIATGAFLPYIEAVRTILINLTRIINPAYVPVQPADFKEVILAVINPVNKNFRHMTPVYLYAVLLIYMIVKGVKKRITGNDLCLICLGGYGLVIYVSAFRSIWAAHFEMALQPEKVLLFFLLEEAYFFFKGTKSRLLVSLRNFSEKQKSRIPFILKIAGINFFFLALFMSSVFFALTRYHKRFYAFQVAEKTILGQNSKGLKSFQGKGYRSLTIKRAQGLWVPAKQAEELESVVSFLKERIPPDESVMTYQELAAYHFFADRPFVGRFPMPFFTWFNDRWHKEFLSSFVKERPRFVIFPQRIPQNWKDAYLTLEPNKKKFDEIMALIQQNYTLVKKTPLSFIYEKNRIWVTNPLREKTEVSP